MEEIKTEPEIDLLAVQKIDNRNIIQKDPLSEIGKFSDVQICGVKREWTDPSPNLISLTNHEEVFVKNEMQESCDVVTMKKEPKVEETTATNEFLIGSVECYDTRPAVAEKFKNNGLHSDEKLATVFERPIACTYEGNDIVGTTKTSISNNSNKKIEDISMKQDICGNINDSLEDILHSYKCGTCEKRICKSSNLKDHMLFHTSRKQFECNECGKSFPRRSSLKSHARIHTGEMHYKCNVCGKSFQQKNNLRDHVQCHSKESLTCDACGKCFTRKKYLKSHIRRDTCEKAFKCEVCGKRFIDTSILKQHLFSHTGKEHLICDICGNSYVDMDNLKKHLLVHKHKMPFKCEICGMAFPRFGPLKNHLREHIGEKLICLPCGKCFSEPGDLRSHLLMVHSEKKTVKCDICEKNFSTSSTLKRHLEYIHKHKD